MPATMEVLEAMRDMLPPPAEIFPLQHFRSQIYPVELLYCVADFCRCRDIDESFLDESEVSAGDVLMSNLGPHIWLDNVTYTEPEHLAEIISNIKARRKPSRSAETAVPSVNLSEGAEGALPPQLRP